MDTVTVARGKGVESIRACINDSGLIVSCVHVGKKLTKYL